ncbi:hypothetical protein [Mesorhizobium sp. M7A.F.Ce.TU.012.03.2.1]|uniref:hypothetical protein n=1 Tax=Mesorhizobium sp. M7A.F.Ce.TU.012.03.2.1 TaxID=2493681 RepID=UPI000FD6D13B|nr:hypothetical protein [Mesorhizobium sp. M7A.F.Ce.TU.012.03.2.1]AZV21488.1 hypothetical protein EJ079_21840 [Mesorhizobium sp. M7A.F.Ce.TU.012.03.2.1]
MADNTTITPGVGVTVALDDVGGVMHQRVKISLGADGSATDALGGAGAVAAGVQRVTLASDDPAVAGLGALTETAPATDTASSGLNGRLQRIAQRLTSLIALLPASLGAKTGAASLSVVPASDAAFALAAGTALVGKVKTKFIEAVSATMTRPNDTSAYAANDAVANSTTAGSVTPFSFSMSDVNDDLFTIERLRLITSDTGVAGKALRMWLFRASPTVAAGDNAAFSNPRSTFIGSLSGTMRTFSDGSGGIFVPDEGSRIITLPTSGAKTVFGLLQTLEAVASPLAQSTWIATLEGFQGAA